jgi:hypothetical protein
MVKVARYISSSRLKKCWRGVRSTAVVERAAGREGGAGTRETKKREGREEGKGKELAVN